MIKFISSQIQSRKHQKTIRPPDKNTQRQNLLSKQPFADGKEYLTLQVEDRWGTWTSTLIPIKDEETGKTIAVFGMDFNAQSLESESVV